MNVRLIGVSYSLCIGERWLKSRTDRRGDPPSKFVAEILRAAARTWSPLEELSPAVARINPDATGIGSFYERRGGATLDGVQVNFSARQFVGGIMDLRFIPDVAEDRSMITDTSLYAVLLDKLATDPYDALLNVPYWMVIGDALYKSKIINILYRFFPGHEIILSEYIYTTAESSFNGLKAHHRGGSQTLIFILHDNRTPDFKFNWPTEVTSLDPRFLSRKSYVGEQKLKDHRNELRMEVYIRFVQEVKGRSNLTEFEELNFLTVLAGRKPLIAVMVTFKHKLSTFLRFPSQLTRRLEVHFLFFF